MIKMRNRRVILVIVSCVVLSLVAVFSIHRSRVPHQSESTLVEPSYDSEFPYENGKVYGIDVSHYQGDIDWETVARRENVTFVYVRASMGHENKDDLCKQNVEAARSQGFLVGIYHFFYLQENVEQQFKNFDEMYSSLTTDLIPVLDVEPQKIRRRGRYREKFPPKYLCDSVEKFISLFCEKYPSEQMVLYAPQTFYNNFLSKRFPMMVKWIANYSAEPQLRDSLFYHVWQFTDTGKLHGIQSNVDMNVIVRDDALMIMKKASPIRLHPYN